jgi:hypothetical protein
LKKCNAPFQTAQIGGTEALEISEHEIEFSAHKELYTLLEMVRSVTTKFFWTKPSLFGYGFGFDLEGLRMQ